jgi:hypothetical protein
MSHISKAILSFSYFASFAIVVHLQAAEVVQRSNNDYALIGARIVTVKGKLKSKNTIMLGPEAGTSLTGGCEIEFKLGPGERAIEARGKSPTRTTEEGCELEMEIGQPPEDKLPPKSQPKTEGSTPRVAADARSIGGERSASPGISSGYAQGWFTDPPGFWVNSEQVNISWIWTSPFSCAYLYSYSRSVPASFPGWLNASNVTYPIWNCVPTYPFPFSQMGASTISHWQNNVFPLCLGTPVHAWYNPITAYGDQYGNLVGNMSWSLSGPYCINLLSPNFQLVRTYN